jgi:diguanylate cyclase (GGDEF)-like protein/PAS domain S-box-containing protein
MARALVLLFASGTLLGLIAVPLSEHLTGPGTVGLGLACAVSLGAAALIGFGWRRLSSRTFQVLLVLATLVVTAVTYLTSALPADTEMFYVWVALYASYFFTRAETTAQIGLVGIFYAAALALGESSGNEVARWVITMGTLVVSAALFRYIRRMLDRRLAETDRSEVERERSLSLLRATLEATADGILVVDREGRMVHHNRKFVDMWRVPDDIVESRNSEKLTDFIVDQLAESAGFLRKLNELQRQPEADSYGDVLHFKDGRIFERHSQPQRGADGTIYGRVWSFSDITEQERIESRLRTLADHDPLTGLLNRRRFEEELAELVAHTARYGSGGAVLLLDLDDFKYVNDSLGHRTGDALLRSIAALLGSRLRESDVLARLGGDEFAVLLPQADEEQARLVAESLLDTVRGHRALYRGVRVRITTSVGVALIGYPEVQTAEELLVEADVAMYGAKEAGRDRLSVSEPSQRRRRVRDGASTSLAWSARIRRALDKGRLALYLQPILDLRDNEISQYELLLRMVGDGGKLVPPRAFLPSAERSGLIEEIDVWVAREAIRLIDDRRRAGGELRLEVNLSGRTLGSSHLPEIVARELTSKPINPANLIFEVTETAAVLNMDEARRFATALTHLGCRFALDDFGTGFGSFYYLKHLPLDYLKIDGDFIVGLARHPTDQAVVQAIVDLSRRLGKQTIAEYVGDARTIQLLREYGVDYAQGHYIGRPQRLAELWAEIGAGVAVEQKV